MGGRPAVLHVHINVSNMQVRQAYQCMRVPLVLLPGLRSVSISSSSSTVPFDAILAPRPRIRDFSFANAAFPLAALTKTVRAGATRVVLRSSRGPLAILRCLGLLLVVVNALSSRPLAVFLLLLWPIFVP